MTTIARPLQRETASFSRRRAIIIELHSGFMVLREKGKRTRFTLDYLAAFHLACKQAANQARLEKLAAKKARAAR